MYKHRPGEHPANLVALAMAGSVVLAEHGALLADVALEFCKWKQLILHALRERFGASVYVPDFFYCT